MGERSTAHHVETVVLADELLDAMVTLRRTIRRQVGRSPLQVKLTVAQYDLVALLRRRPGLAVAEAARELGLAPNTVSTLVRQLRTAGVVERGSDPRDRRVATLNLTPEARRRMATWRDRRVLAVGEALASLSQERQRALADAVGSMQALTDKLRDAQSAQ